MNEKMKTEKSKFTNDIGEVYKRFAGYGKIEFDGDLFAGDDIMEASTAYFKIVVNGRKYDVKMCKENEMLF